MARNPHPNPLHASHLKVIKGRTPKAIASRKLPGRNTEAFRRYAQRIGVALLAWNDLHANLYMIFWHVIGLNEDFAADEQVANRIWHTIQSDKTQREMLWNAAEIKLAKKQQESAALRWILKQTGDLAQCRNVAAHVPVLFHETTGMRPRPNPWSSRKEAGDVHRLINHEKFWRLLAGDLSALSRYTGRLAERLMAYGIPRPLLNKPVLQAADEFRRIKDQLSRQKQAQKPPPKVVRPKAKKGTKPKK